ncbi:MAG TPA: medium chain dehydrogenase/reductase family protein [Myxococcota bacterium]|nr:medium chain dehydrogenase/reductase family protein [Myxococcota bacterium]
MRQIWTTRVGGPEVLEVREAADPVAGPGQVRVRAKAAGLNFAEIMARIGLYPDAPKLPTVMGYEVAGEVDQVGAGVSALSVGDRVLALTRFGGHSDTVVVPADQVATIPATLSFEKAAAIPVNYATAWLMLIHLGNLRAGETVLVHAAAGGVGQAALQICRWKGATVIGTASPSKHGRLKELGVTHCVDYTKDDFETEVMRLTDGRGVDVVLDAVGGKSFAKSYRVLRSLGRLFMFGGSGFVPGEKKNPITLARQFFAMPSFKPFDLMDLNKGVFGVNLGHLWDRTAELQAMLREILTLVEDGTFDPVLDQVFRFDEAAKAHERMKGRQNFGKIVLVP